MAKKNVVETEDLSKQSIRIPDSDMKHDLKIPWLVSVLSILQLYFQICKYIYTLNL